MEIVKVNTDNIEIFSKVLTESAKWLDSIGQSMWNIDDLTVEELMKKYDINDMKLCYEYGNLAGVYVLQWYDSLFWSELNANESGILHKLAVCREYRKMGYGKKIIKSAESLCKSHGANSLRLNCGTLRPKLRNFYESAGFKMVDRVFIDNRDQIRYWKSITVTS
jgi:GNAT superfamily N-acetyltransferase